MVDNKLNDHVSQKSSILTHLTVAHEKKYFLVHNHNLMQFSVDSKFVENDW
jgi:hypothetical protein